MKKERIIIKKMGINGEGIGYLNKKVVFVKGALTNEEVEVELDQSNQRFYTGKLIKVLTPSTNRRRIECYKSKECLGCTLLHASISSQELYKKELIRETLGKYYQDNPNLIAVKDIISNHKERNYKNLVTLPIAKFNNQVRFGIFQRESRYFTEMSDCFLQSKRINLVLKQLEELFQLHKTKEYNDRFKTGLRFLIVKEMDNKLQLIFITGKDGLKASLLDDIKNIQDIVSVYVSKNTSKYQEFEIEKYEKIYGKDYMSLTFNHKKYQVSAKSEIPINLAIAELIANSLPSLLPKEITSILEINAGIGLYTLAIPKSMTVKSINQYSYYSNDLKANAEKNEHTNIEVETGKFAELTGKILKNKQIDAVLLHGDRNPIDDKLIEELTKSKITYLLYLSENVSTCIKDINKISKKFGCDFIQAFDTTPNNIGMALFCHLTVKQKKTMHNKKNFTKS